MIRPRLLLKLKRHGLRSGEFNYLFANNYCAVAANRKWENATKQAENIVGYETTFLNLKSTLNDEIAKLAGHIKSVVHTNHPLPGITKKYLINNDYPSFGLVILLMSKIAGAKNAKHLAVDENSGILRGQRVLAEVAEMIRMTFLMHKNVIDVDPNSADAHDLNHGNKLALLIGDFLLTRSFRDLAGINNSDVDELMSTVLMDCTESNFLSSLPSKPEKNSSTVNYLDDYTSGTGPYKFDTVQGKPKEEWAFRNILQSANLLGKTCKASLLFANHDNRLQDVAYLFGRNFALSLQAKIDCDEFLSDSADLNVVSAPVSCYLQEFPHCYDELKESADNASDAKRLINKILNSSAIEDSRNMGRDFAKKSLKMLDNFESSDSKEAMINVVNALLK